MLELPIAIHVRDDEPIVVTDSVGIETQYNCPMYLQYFFPICFLFIFVFLVIIVTIILS